MRVRVVCDWSAALQRLVARGTAVVEAAQAAATDTAQAAPGLMARALVEQGYPATEADVRAITGVQSGVVVVRYLRRRMIDCDAQQVAGGVSVRLRGGRVVIPHAFIARSRRGLDVFVRDVTAGKTYMRRLGQRKWMAEPVRVLDADSVAGMLSQPAARDAVADALGVDLRQRMRERLGSA